MEPSTNALILLLRLYIKGIIHIGANKFQELNDYVHINIPNVLWIDTHKEFIEFGEKLILEKSINNHRCLTATLSDKSEIAPFYLTRDLRDSSLNEPDNSNERGIIGVIDVQTTRMDELCISEKIDMSLYDTVICDIQGGELNALIGFGNNLFNINNIIIESWVDGATEYKNLPTANQTKEYLNKFGFKLMKNINYTDHWGESIYTRIL